MSNKQLLKEIYFQARDAALPKNFIHKYCSLQGDILTIQTQQFDLANYKNIYLFGSGKAAFTMAKEMEHILQERITGGMIVTTKQKERLRFIKICESSHPIPTQKSIDCAKKLASMMQDCQEDDLYIYLLSGGSSSLIEIPKAPITLQDLQQCTDLMIKHTLDIQKINTVRKHLSKIKGGKLAQLTKAQGVVLVLSDVIGDDLSTIGSAPLFFEESPQEEAKNILKESTLFAKMPPSVQEVLLIDEQPIQTPQQPPHFILASNKLALQAAYHVAKKKGLQPVLIQKPMSGDVTCMAQEILQKLQEFPKQCIILGGECTVGVKGDGKGGRNQHLVLLLLEYICKHDSALTFLSAGTDGIDGNSDAAGAVVDGASCKKTTKNAIKASLENFDSYTLLKGTGDLIVTGNSGTNVIDIAIALQQ